MTSTAPRLLIAAALAATFTVFAAQSFTQGSSMPAPELHAQHLSQRAEKPSVTPAERQAKLQQRRAERQAALKTKLNITTEQEPAWNAFVARTAPAAQVNRHTERQDGPSSPRPSGCTRCKHAKPSALPP